jgi:hypothetical protein
MLVGTGCPNRKVACPDCAIKTDSAAHVAGCDALFASVSREDLIHLCIFLAGYQAKLQDVRGECMSMVGDDRSKAWETVINHWPIIQGSRNQIHLIRIGELGYDPAAVARAVKGAGEPAAQLLEKENATTEPRHE